MGIAKIQMESALLPDVENPDIRTASISLNIINSINGNKGMTQPIIAKKAIMLKIKPIMLKNFFTIYISSMSSTTIEVSSSRVKSVSELNLRACLFTERSNKLRT